MILAAAAWGWLGGGVAWLLLASGQPSNTIDAT
jgi:hypothetical protein